MDSPFVVRPATATDAEVWRVLRHRALTEAPSAYGSTIAEERDRPAASYAARLADGNAVLGFAGDAPVGMGAGYVDRPGWFHLVAVWVDPSCRGRGLNGLLLAALCARADALGLRVHLDVNATNAAAVASYERFGFVRTREQRPLREGSEERCARMVLPVRLKPPVVAVASVTRRVRWQGGASEGGPAARRGATTQPARPDGGAQQARADGPRLRPG